MSTPAHILVGTDFSEASQAAVFTARDYAKKFDVRLTLLHVYSAQLDTLGPAAARAERMQIGREVHDALSALKDRTSGVKELHTEILAGDDAASILCDYARNNGVGLIVVGSHGTTGLKRLLIGSVAERVVRQASCPVLVVH